MSKITNLDDYRTTTKYGRAVKRQRHAHFMNQYNKFMSKAGKFFDKANSERGRRMIKDQEDGE